MLFEGKGLSCQDLLAYFACPSVLLVVGLSQEQEAPTREALYLRVSGQQNLASWVQNLDKCLDALGVCSGNQVYLLHHKCPLVSFSHDCQNPQGC